MDLALQRRAPVESGVEDRVANETIRQLGSVARVALIDLINSPIVMAERGRPHTVADR